MYPKIKEQKRKAPLCISPLVSKDNEQSPLGIHEGEKVLAFQDWRGKIRLDYCNNQANTSPNTSSNFGTEKSKDEKKKL